jgi:hypothetical protein
MHYLKMSPKEYATLPSCMAENFFLRFSWPFGSADFTGDLLCWWALEVPKYVGAPTALNIRQTRQTVDLGFWFPIDN